jgi:hypothetical protein
VMRGQQVRGPSSTLTFPPFPFHLQFTVPHQRDRCIDMTKSIIEPLTLFATPDQDEHSAFPVITTKNFFGKQLTDFSSSGFDRADVGSDPITLREQGFVHAWYSSCNGGSSMSEAIVLFWNKKVLALVKRATRHYVGSA